MKNKKIVLLTRKSISSNIVFNAIEEKFGVYKVIVEQKEGFWLFTKRRIKNIGLATVIGQILFRVFVISFLSLISKVRINKIIDINKLVVDSIPTCKIFEVESINKNEVINLLRDINPDLIIVHGTRIISKRILESVQCKFINIHAGITPKYRGVHGAYWALVNGDYNQVGVTVHFIDTGIDTGDVILQDNIQISKQDNFVTYPFIQLALGIKLLLKTIEAYMEDTMVAQNTQGDSHLWYHPTLWEYLYYRIVKKVK